jgi:hypothetical protein
MRVTESHGQMNLLSRYLYLLFAPRLPRFTPEDVSGTADYYNRLARHHEANMDPSGAWTRRISLQLAVRILPSVTAKNLPQNILRRVTRAFQKALLQNQWKIVLQK